MGRAPNRVRKHPVDRADFGLDWSRVLYGQDIATSTWELPGGITFSQSVPVIGLQLAIKPNYFSFSEPYGGIAYIHGYFAGAAADIPPKLWIDGRWVTMPAPVRVVNGNWSEPYTGYIVIDTANTTPFWFPVNQPTNYGIVVKIDGFWYRLSQGTLAEVTPTDSWLAVATISGPGGSGLQPVTVNLFDYPVRLLKTPDERDLVSSDVFPRGLTRIWLQGGEPGRVYRLRNTVTTVGDGASMTRDLIVEMETDRGEGLGPEDGGQSVSTGPLLVTDGGTPIVVV